MHVYVIAIFGILALVLILLHGKIGAVLNIPRAKLVYAKVIAKQPSGRISHINSGNMTNYRIHFEFDDSKTLILSVPRKVHESVSEGSRGVLVYTGSTFREFHVDKKIPDIQPNKKRR